MVSLIDLTWFFFVTGLYFLRESHCCRLEKTQPRYNYLHTWNRLGPKSQGMLLEMFLLVCIESM